MVSVYSSRMPVRGPLIMGRSLRSQFCERSRVSGENYGFLGLHRCSLIMILFKVLTTFALAYKVGSDQKSRDTPGSTPACLHAMGCQVDLG